MTTLIDTERLADTAADSIAKELGQFAQLEGRHQDCERDYLLATHALNKASDAGQVKLTQDQLAMLNNGSSNRK